MKNKAPEKKASLADRFGGFVDGVISVFNPKAAYTRRAYRKASGALSSYRGAASNRFSNSWHPGGGSADEDILPDLSMLRERSRDLNRNDAHAVGITGTINQNVIGTGIKPQSRTRAEKVGMPEESIAEYQKNAEDIFQLWMNEADASDRLDFQEIQGLVDRQILENGEILLIPQRLNDPRRKFKTCFEIIEADRLMTPHDKRQDKHIRDGVEIGPRGEPLAYWIFKGHPGDTSIRRTEGGFNSPNFIRYPARNILGRKNVWHLYHTLRPGQTRGVPFFAPVLNYFEDLAEYMESELVAARVAACFAIFIKKEDAFDNALASTSETSGSQRLQNLEPGMIEHLNPGESIEGFNPNRPGGTFDPFVNRILRAISAALGLPYELVAKDFSQTNYSSARAALLEARRYFRMRQEWISRKLNQPAYELVMEEAFLKGMFGNIKFYEMKDEFCRTVWIAQGWQCVDPVKEVESSRIAIETGISNLANESAASGQDWEDILEQRAREQKKIKDLEEKFDIKMSKEDKNTAQAPDNSPANDSNKQGVPNE